jgi:hypothetical protein
MRIENKTDWDTRDLKTLINRTMKEVGVEHDRIRRIVINSQKRNRETFISGLATIGGSWIEMKLPRNPPIDVKRFVQVLTHEIHHNLGLQHDDMVSSLGIDTSWVNGFQVNQKIFKPKIEIPLTQQRYNHAIQKLKQKEQLLRRTQTLVNKWKKKVRYYEKIGERKD